MGAKAPKITPAQRELEALQLRTLREQEREQNTEAQRVAMLQRRLMLGTMGYNQFLMPGVNRPAAAAVPAAQAAGTTLAPDLADPAIAALDKRTRLTEMASGYGTQFAAATTALALRRRI